MRPQFLAAALLGLLALAGCKREDMYTQRASRTWDRNAFFSDGASMRPPVAGTIARDAPNPDVPAPATIDAALLARGQQRYDIFCADCHGRTGDGDGMIVERGFLRPASLVEGTLRDAKTQTLYDAITKGAGAMYGFATRVSPADRWAIVAYIRALALSQNAAVASLPAEDRARLEAAR